MKQTVVILSGVFPSIRCGVSSHTYVVAQAVSKLRSWDVHVLTSDSPDIDKNLPRDFELHPVIGKWSVFSLPRIVNEIEKLKPDVLHIQNPTNAYNGKLDFTMPLLPRAGKRLWAKTRLVVTQHDLAIGHWISQWKHGLLLKRARAVTVSNDRDYQAVLRILPRLKERTYLARIASHFSPRELTRTERDSVRNELKTPPNGALLLYFGFIVPGRRIDTLIRAAAVLKAQGLVFHLVLMGGPGPGADNYLASCKSLATQLAVDDHVTWMGYTDCSQVERTIPAADVFISPIERGADFRNSSLFPAIQSGVPILATENPKYGIDRELRAWNICRFFDPSSPQNLADSVLSLLRDDPAKSQIREAMARLTPRLTWEEHARVLDLAYRGEPPEPYDPSTAAKETVR